MNKMVFIKHLKEGQLVPAINFDRQIIWAVNKYSTLDHYELEETRRNTISAPIEQTCKLTTDEAFVSIFNESSLMSLPSRIRKKIYTMFPTTNIFAMVYPHSVEVLVQKNYFDNSVSYLSMINSLFLFGSNEMISSMRGLEYFILDENGDII